jgi:hypothetical protein
LIVDRGCKAETKGNVAIKAIFVGINKHLDPTIPELSGAP